VRISAVLFLIVSLAACNGAKKNNDAVRQGVLDYLATKGMNSQTMDINIVSVKYNGDTADATVSFAAKGSGAGQMSIQYRLENQSGKWKVVGKQDANQHGGAAAAPGGAPQDAGDPHGGGAPVAGGKMPSPDDLPPAGQKK